MVAAAKVQPLDLRKGKKVAESLFDNLDGTGKRPESLLAVGVEVKTLDTGEYGCIPDLCCNGDFGSGNRTGGAF